MTPEATLLAKRIAELTDELAQAREETRRLRDENIDLQVWVSQLQEAQSILERNRWLEHELQLASRIQTSILPRGHAIPSLEIGARMATAATVGGDYYDVQPCADGAWIGIGDVAGHGVTAGLVMLMTQGVVAAAARAWPSATPRQILPLVNEILVDNLRGRLQIDEFVTFTLFRHFHDGRVVFAGAHEDVIWLRAQGQRTEMVPTPGPWLGHSREVGRFCTDTEIRLDPGDLLVLYTDGITESRNASGEMFGIDRLAAALDRRRDLAAGALCDAVLDEVAAWSTSQEDDRTVVVLRHLGA